MARGAVSAAERPLLFARGHGALPPQGQTPFDVADEGLVEHLEALQKQQSAVSVVAVGAPAGRASVSWVLSRVQGFRAPAVRSRHPRTVVVGVAQVGKPSDSPSAQPRQQTSTRP